MSRHKIDGKDANHEIVVGWDPPLRTYFGQVYDRRRLGTDNELIHWVGAGPPQLRTTMSLQLALEAYVELTPDMHKTLLSDKDLDV